MLATVHPFRFVLGWGGAVWGFGGVAGLLAFAVWRLVPRAWEALQQDLSALQGLALAAWVAFMAGVEGYRGFQRAFSPRVAARCRHLREHPTALRVALAPLFAMAFFAAPRRRRVSAYVLTTGIVLFVVLVQDLPQPWRGIVDAGVVVGLTYGLVTLAACWVRAMTCPSFAASSARRSEAT